MKHNKVTCLKTGFLVWRKNELKVKNTFWVVLLPLSRRQYSSQQLPWQPRITHSFKWWNKNNKNNIVYSFWIVFLGLWNEGRYEELDTYCQHKTNNLQFESEIFWKQLLNRLTPWSGVLLNQLTVVQPNSLSLTKPFGSSQCSKESDTDPYSSHHSFTLFL